MEYKHKFINFLCSRLKSELPGTDAHRQMMPEIKSLPFRSMKTGKQPKRSAVLLLLYSYGEALNIILTLRSKKLSNHSGQISFPGGQTDKKEQPVETALRETEEEIGVGGASVNVIGILSDLYVPPTNYIITPVVGYMEYKPDYFINSAHEVEEILDIPLDMFSDRSVFSVETWEYEGKELKVPLWKIHSQTPLWGATSMIMKEFLMLYDEFNSLTGK